MSDLDTTIGGRARGFPSTHWSVVMGCRDRSAPEWSERVNALAQLYWRPVYRYVRICWRKSNEDAKDLTQEFFEEILAGRFLEEAANCRGRFRTFVKACLENFLRRERRDAERLKRGGGRFHVRLEADDAALQIASPDAPPGEVLDRQWRQAVIEQAVQRMSEAYAREGRKDTFELFRRYDLAKSAAERPTYAHLAREFAISPSDVDNRLSHARARLFEMVGEIVAESVTSPEALSEELRALFPGRPRPQA